MNNQFFKGSANLAIISISLLSIINILVNNKLNLVVIIWGLHICLQSNIRRLPYDFYFFRLLRYVCYYIILIVGTVVYFLYVPEQFDINVVSLIVFFSCIILFYLSNYKVYKVLLNNSVIYEMNKGNKTSYVAQVIMAATAPLFEECFYRGIVLSIENVNIIVLIGLSVFLFVCNHKAMPWGNEFKKKDVIVEVFISIANIYLYLTTKSVFLCIVLHFIMNIPEIILYIKRFLLHYTNFIKVNVNDFTEDDFFD